MGTAVSQAAMFGVGTCVASGKNWKISKWKNGDSMGLNIYHPCTPRCSPTNIWNPDKLVCTKRCAVQFRLEAPGQLYLVECETIKVMHLYKCGKKCSSEEEDGKIGKEEAEMVNKGGECDVHHVPCQKGAVFRGESKKQIQCSGFYKERIYGHRGENIGCANIPLSLSAFLGCSSKKGGSCADSRHRARFCPHYKRRGYCRHRHIKGWCKKTCGACGGVKGARPAAMLTCMRASLCQRMGGIE